MMLTRKPQNRIDYALLVGVLLLVGIGLVMVYSASFYKLMVKDHDIPEAYLFSGIQFAAFGVFAMFVISFVNYKFLKRFTGILIALAVFLGIYVLLKGDVINGSKRWINLFGISIMPSEITKVAVLMSTAAYASGLGAQMKKWYNFAIGVFMVVALSSLTMLQPDLSTAGVTVVLGMSILFLAECRLHHFAVLVLGGISGVAGLIAIAPYRAERVAVFLQTLLDRTYVFDDTRRQIMYSIYAVGSGGIKGVGLGMGELKNLRLPEPYNDFIFSIIAEELGLLGALVVLLIFAFVIYRIFLIAIQAPDRYGFLIAAGAGLLISFQVIINVGVATNLLPTTGIPLPFVSKGGSSLLIMMGLIGIVLNISSQRRMKV